MFKVLLAIMVGLGVISAHAFYFVAVSPVESESSIIGMLQRTEIVEQYRPNCKMLEEIFWVIDITQNY